MNQTPSLVQVYRLTNREFLGSAHRILSDLPGFNVDARNRKDGAFLVVESRDADRALMVYELVLTADPDAELIDATSGPVPTAGREPWSRSVLEPS